MRFAPIGWDRFAIVGGLLLAPLSTTLGQALLSHPRPGDVYKEFSRTINGYANYRVTDPNATNPGAQANLPNAVLQLTIGDLQGAVRAEAVIDLWGGHAGTVQKKIRFNGKAWLSIPEVLTTPTAGECYHTQYNVVIPVPLSDLIQGSNTFEGTNGGQTCHNFNWGQHGMLGIIVRVYYDASRPHPAGSITSPIAGDVLSDNPLVTASASSGSGIAQVDFIAYYNGMDTDGDGVYQDWQYSYHRGPSETSMRIKNHVGTVTGEPYQVQWNTGFVPDQAAGSIQLLARIKDQNGVWYVTQPVTGLSLQRTGFAVRLYRSTSVPEQFAVRVGQVKSCRFTIPSTDSLKDAVSATMVLASYNGVDSGAASGETHYTLVNTWTAPTYGYDHYYKLDFISMPTVALKAGQNTFQVSSQSSLTGIWIYWPGPMYVVRYNGAYASPSPMAPTLSSPLNGSVDVSLPVALRWLRAPAASLYRVQLSQDSLFTQVLVDDSTLTDTAMVVGGLQYRTKYFWRVRAKNSAGSGPFSPAWSFVASAGGPALIAPPDGSVGQPIPVTLQWEPRTGALAYHVQVSGDSGFADDFALNDSVVIEPSRSVSGLEQAKTYYWRVAARSIAGSGIFSEPWKFATAVSVPPAVDLLVPEQHAVVANDTVVFQWRRPATPATGYWLEIGYDSAFFFKTIDTLLVDTTKTVWTLQNNLQYLWRVRAKNAVGWGPYSDSRHFHLMYTGVKDKAEIPAEFTLGQNYPNPFNPSTQISFGLPRESDVVLEVFNVIGERMVVLAEGVLAAGKYTVTFDAARHPAGVYIYRLRAAEHTLTMKMLLVK